MSDKFDALFDPVSRILAQSIDDIFKYINNNKEEMKATLVEMAENDPNPVVQRNKDHPDMMLLATAMAMMEEGVSKYSNATLACQAMGASKQGWDALYSTWIKHRNHANSILPLKQ